MSMMKMTEAKERMQQKNDEESQKISQSFEVFDHHNAINASLRFSPLDIF